jgi:hypothetical protein
MQSPDKPESHQDFMQVCPENVAADVEMFREHSRDYRNTVELAVSLGSP